MSSERQFEFTKENIDTYLKEVAKEYRKQAGKKVPAELVLIGGASVLINYGFRNMTTDIDALIHAASAMKDAISRVGDRYELPNGWLNADFSNTSSYSDRLYQFSEYYRTFSNIVTVRTISAEYLIAMKLRSGRQYKSDLSDILGILLEHERSERPISMDQIRKAVIDLYGNWETLPELSRTFIMNVMEDGHFEKMYNETVRGEEETKNLLIDFGERYPGLMKESNVDKIAEVLQGNSDRASIFTLLREKKQSEMKYDNRNNEALER